MSFLRDPKRLIATIIAGAVGLIVLIDFAGAIAVVDLAARTLVNWAALIAALALVVGLLSVAASHFVRVLRREADWGYSLVLLIAMLLVITSGTIVGLVPDGYVRFPQSLVEQPIRDLFRAFYQPLAGSFLALLVFFSLSAALRALRRRTTDALVIMIVAVVVLLVAALPQAQALPLLGNGVRVIADYVVLAGARGLLIGAALGAVVAGIRVLLGFDQPYLDR
jgi:Na+-driven multidrug efflux pump